MVKSRLHGLTPDRLVAELADRGVTLDAGRARRLLAHGVSHGRHDFALRKQPLGRALVETLAEHTSWERPEVLERVPAEGGSCRYLFRAHDGVLFEAVLIPLEAEGRYTACLSSQAGCAMACAFCATGRLGLARHLEAWEMVGAWTVLRDEALGRLKGAVFMGQGEPFHNYDAVMQAAEVLAHPCGGRIAAEAITVSTVGLVPQLHRFAEERRPYRLAVSLTSAVQARREELLPVAARWSLDELAAAISACAEASRSRVTVAWVVLGGVNTGDDEVEALRRFAELPIRLDLIDVNDARPEGYRRATDDELERFRDGLHALGVPVVRRYSIGRDQHAACGMLASTRARSW